MALLDRFKKQPSDNLKYNIDYSAWLPSGVSVSNSVVSSIDVVNPASTDVGEPTLTISSPVIVGGTIVQYFASSGTDGKTYKVTFLATMTDTQALESEIEFRVTDR
jgi:hypothetical protein